MDPGKNNSMADSDEPPQTGHIGSPRELLQSAAAMVNRGALPREDTGRILAGPGENRRCSLCAEVIGSAEVEYEMTAGNASSYLFHIPCYFAWKQVVSTNGSGGNR
jgi:hypothetical protein